ncbi:MAG: hypothetical protein CVU39_12585 [Chloroflexi bacterium HGW-Chloroflexi-10]|nr:MAG: hypothetical protein CVU39_12585 [Chloroflexi bacterium HGW-Chloroflexi-10]
MNVKKSLWKHWVSCGCLLWLLYCSACQPNINATPAPDEVQRYLWVGDDLISAGPLDMQSLLMISLSNYPYAVDMRRWVKPQNVLTEPVETAALVEKLELMAYDVVVLQLFGVRRDFEDNAYLDQVVEWIEVVRGQEKIAVLLYPWFSEVDSDAQKERMDGLVHQAAWRTQIVLIPVGPAWQTVQAARPDIQLYASDGLHPSAEGVYLSACVVYAVFTGTSPVGHPGYTSIGYDDPQQIVTIDEEVAAYLQTAAWETILDYQQKDEFQVILFQKE